MPTCPACLATPEGRRPEDLAGHLDERASASDPDHVRWLNQNLSRRRLPIGEISEGLRRFFDLGGGPLSGWIKRRFIEKFYGPTPHPFVLALQRPSRTTLLGYVLEHQAFLRQWVRCCAYILARTDRTEVIAYEIDNIVTEFGGSDGRPSHYELLLRMGESLGYDRAGILAVEPLPATRRAIAGWNAICAEQPWVAALAAMHGLELIASRTLVDDGASMQYFDPSILEGDRIPAAAQAFLREGYEADVGHSEAALRLVDRCSTAEGLPLTVQAVALRSFDLFDDYLIARLERGDSLAD